MRVVFVLSLALMAYQLVAGCIPAAIAQGSGDEAATATFLDNGVTAHRGNSGEFPENTLAAFHSAIELGADWIELDVFLTRDGRLAVIHDSTTGRTGDLNRNVNASTFQELQAIDVATDFRRRTGKGLDECPPARVPSLSEVLQRILQQQRTRVSIQPKMDCVAEAIDLIRKMGAERWVGFNDGNLRLMAKVKQLAPEIPVFWDRGPDSPIDEDIRLALQHGFEAMVIHHSGVTPEKVKKAKAADLSVGAWTVNDKGEMSRLLAMGVDRIYTDFPARLLELKEQCKQRETNETR